jgi:hypothetical protein
VLLELSGLDPWDPNNWEAANPPTEFRIYADDRAEVFALVDEIDYHYFVQWRWKTKTSKGGKKVYLIRSVHHTEGPDVRIDGRRYQRRYMQTVQLHVEIMKRTGIKRPTKQHTITDHRNGRERDCRRANLRWQTPKGNSNNIHGKAAQGAAL